MGISLEANTSRDTMTGTSSSSSSNSIDSSKKSDVKKVYLIRHAESEENHRFHSLRRCLRQVSKLSVPEYEDVSTSMELLNVEAQINANLSDIGERQVASMAKLLRDKDFIYEKGIQLVVHSSLRRARNTCDGLLGCVGARDYYVGSGSSITYKQQEQKKCDGVKRVVESGLLVERTPNEWLPTNHKSFLTRIAHFEEWLGEQPESVIVIVGHSNFFRTMFNLPFKFGNCDVWEASFDATKNETTIYSTCMREETIGGQHRKWSDNFKATESSTIKDASAMELPAHWSDLRRVYKCELEPED